MNRFAQLIARNKRGAVTIELALIAPVLATMTIGVIDISLAFGRKLELEQAAQRAIEKVMQTTGDLTVADTIKKEAVCQINGSNSDGSCASGRISTSNVTVTYTLECLNGAGDRTSETTSDSVAFDALACDPGEASARYISAVVIDTYRPMFSLHFGTGSNGVYDLRAEAGVRVAAE